MSTFFKKPEILSKLIPLNKIQKATLSIITLNQISVNLQLSSSNHSRIEIIDYIPFLSYKRRYWFKFVGLILLYWSPGVQAPEPRSWSMFGNNGIWVIQEIQWTFFIFFSSS